MGMLQIEWYLSIGFYKFGNYPDADIFLLFQSLNGIANIAQV